MPAGSQPPKRSLEKARAAAASALERRSGLAIAARAFRRWSLLATASVYRDVAAVRECTSATACATVPAFMVECMGCSELQSTTQRLRASLVRMHERLAGRDRLVAYYAAQRDAAVRAADRATALIKSGAAGGAVPAHAEQRERHLDATAAPPQGSLAPPELPPALSEATLGAPRTAPARATMAELFGRHLLPAPSHRVETELRLRVAALERQLRRHDEDPALVVWPRASTPPVSAVTSPVTAGAEVKSDSGAAPKKTPRGEKQPTPRAAGRRRAEASAAAVELGASGRPPHSRTSSNGVTDSEVNAILPPPVVPSGGVAESAVPPPPPRPVSACESIVDEAGAADDLEPAMPTAPAQPSTSSRARSNMAKGSGAGSAASPTAATGLVGTRRPENAPATLSALDDPPSGSSGEGKPAGSSAGANGSSAATIGRPLRLHRVPAEALQVSQPAPIHPRGFPPGTMIRGGAASGNGGGLSSGQGAKPRAAASSAPTVPSASGSGSKGNGAYRVQPQRQPVMGVRSKSGAKR
eukprot:CAMPEP_0174833986 /NCGR_PEP_ID=MMETSP1114-20130205/4564_1 /TAXON_ID=312471 /ORGANISM="Neobodo designis, Strain CCAP 1951/1" /LENGTH=527 /DNA_ID=CAMNT_0016067891 /DNA_START=66 /DNA_END=1649 /DNA_ORIENTATION=-